MKNITILGTLIGALACHHAPSAPVIPRDQVISLERTGCYGTCPSYTVALHADGTVNFNGRAHSHLQGDAVGHVPADSVAAINRSLDAINFSTLPDELTFGSPACPQRITDIPSAIVTRSMAGATKRVVHHPGCKAAPPELATIEMRIDAMTNSRRWTDGQ